MNRGLGYTQQQQAIIQNIAVAIEEIAKMSIILDLLVNVFLQFCIVTYFYVYQMSKIVVTTCVCPSG